MTDLPIGEIIPCLVRTLENHNNVVIQAPPGAGKTTRVPLALYLAPWMAEKKVMMLEPRRVAARSAARFMASQLTEKVGHTVGYQIRMDRKITHATRIEVVTEGILTARLQSDPSLEDIGVVIFDEFHERNLNSDLGLALCLEIQAVLRGDLKIVVMSATLDPAPVADLLGGAPVLVSKGRSWPVETRYIDPAPFDRGRSGYAPPGSGSAALEKACAWAVKDALDREQGDILVFLPGMKEIRRMEKRLKETLTHTHHAAVDILPLHGSLSPEAQDRAIVKNPRAPRKVVTATAIAETSITMDGVSIVIDCGLMRVSRFYPGRGMDRLETLIAPVSSVDQRRGRAGRTGPGICYRLWTRESHGLRPSFPSPEILLTDLADFVLQLALWGIREPGDLAWLDLPPRGAFDQAKTLLIRLGALDADGTITRHGKALVAAGIHPRLAHMILQGRDLGRGMDACYLAALLVERDIFRFSAGGREADMTLRLEFFHDPGRRSRGRKETSSTDAGRINPGAAAGVRATAKLLARKLNIGPGNMKMSQVGRLLSFAFPERIAMARPGRRGFFLMASGAGIRVHAEDSLAGESYIVAVRLDGQGNNAVLFLGAPYTLSWMETDFGEEIIKTDSVAWDRKTKSVTGRREKRYGALLVDSRRLTSISDDRIMQGMIQGIQTEGLTFLPWTKALRSWQARISFLCRTGFYGELPAVDDDTLLESLDTWLAPFLNNVSSAAGIKRVDLSSALKSRLTWQQLQCVEQAAPTHHTVPSGSRIPLVYPGAGDGHLPGVDIRDGGDGPVLAVRLQEMLGCTETPTVAGGRITVTLHLLSPAGRPVQITRDLAGFWKNTYNDVKKDLMGRYPRHYWPDNPLEARPTHRAKPR